MIIYGSTSYIEDNGNGYDLDVRDALCSKCHNLIDKQEKYRGIDDEWRFSKKEKELWEYCPLCGEGLYD